MKHHARTIILLALLIGLPATIMQAQPYNISMSISTQNASCYTDGKIFIRLDGTDLGLLSANDQLNFDVFKDGQIYLSHDFFFGDISDSVVVLDGYPAGDYSMNYDLWIGSQAPISGQLGNFKIADKSSKPFVSLSLGSVGTLHGTRPTLKCKPTGRVQMEIIQGKLPYSVQVYKDGTLLRTEVFNSPMHSGSDPLAEDYQHYYNIENLAKGTYTFVMTDSCGYQQTLSEGVVIDEAEFTCLPDLISGSISTTKNEVSFTLQSKFFQNVKYDNYPGDYLEFRWGIEGETMSGWLPFVSAVGESVPDAEKYYGKKYVFELRVKNCPNYPVCRSEVIIPKPGDPPVTCREFITPTVSLIPITGAPFCPCTGGTSSTKYEEYEVKINFSLCNSPKLPLTYTVDNLTSGEMEKIKVSFNGNSASHTLKEKLDSALFNNRLHFKLEDANKTVILDRIINIPTPAPPPYTPPVPLKWVASHSAVGEGCADPKGYIDVMLNCADIPAGTSIELIDAPNGYRFKVDYDITTGTWAINKNSSDFTVTPQPIFPSSCSFINRMEFTGLFRYGTYKWRITDNSGRNTLVEHSTTDLQYAITKPLSFTSRNTCHGTVYYPHAQVVSFPLHDTNNTTNLPTKFRVLQGNVTGYEINGGTSIIGIANRDSILITKPGRYIIQSFYNSRPSPQGDTPDKDLASCTVDVDTIDYELQTVSYGSHGGSLCANGKNSTIQGSIYISVHENSGVPPYTFYLYGGKDRETGELIGVQTSSSEKVTFEDIKVTGTEFFAWVEDACKSSFPIPMSLSPIIITDVIFGDRNVCRGSSAHLLGKMIGASHNVQYQWKGSDGFSSTDRQVVTPPLHIPETYSLEISGLGCRIFDSITVQPVDTIQIYYEDLICRGTDYSGGSEFLNPLSTAHLAAGLYHFTSDTLPAINGGCDSIAHLALRIVEENEIIEDTSVCANELPFLLQDTIFSRGTPSGVYTIERKKNACRYRLQLTVHPVPSDTLPEVQVCDGEQVVFHGKPYTKTGYYTDTLTCQTTGCDSLVTLHLTVNPLHTTNIYDSIYAGDSYSRYNFSLPVQNEIGSVTDNQLAKNVYGCDSTVFLYLAVLSPEVVIPEGFSPNDDGINDYFVIKNIHLYPESRFLVFNRWGNKLYEGKPYMNRWDGKNYSGGNVGSDDLPAGTYYYILELGNSYKAKTGFFYLSR